MKYIGSLHNYLQNSLLLFERTTLDATSVKSIHLKSRGNYEQDNHAKKTMKIRKRKKIPCVLIATNKGMMQSIAGNCI